MQPVKLSVERHLVDEQWREQQMNAGTHLLDHRIDSDDPEMVVTEHPDAAAALARLDEIAAEWGCEAVEEVYGGGMFAFNGPEEEEVQGYARLEGVRFAEGTRVAVHRDDIPDFPQGTVTADALFDTPYVDVEWDADDFGGPYEDEADVFSLNLRAVTE